MTRTRRIPPALVSLTAAVAAVTCAVALAGCGTGRAPRTDPAGAAFGEGSTRYPVSYPSCGLRMTVRAPPARAVANDVNIVTIMLALGLEQRMAGISGVGPDEAKVLDRYGRAWRDLPVLSRKYFTRENLLAAGPDFVLAGYNYGFEISGTDGVSPRRLRELGIPSYAIRESCPDRSDAVTLADTYADIRTVARVFDVPSRAARLIEEMKHRVAKATAGASRGEPVPVFVYDSGRSAPVTAAGTAVPTDIIARAGGRNIFTGLAKSWTTVSWEQVVTRRPRVIVIVDYGAVPAARKRRFLETNPATRDLPAVRDGNIVVLPYANLTPGPGNVRAVERLARFLPRVAAGR